MTDPLFSIVIPTFDRAKALVRCLEAIEKLEFNSSMFEVVIVNDGGKDPAPLLESIKTNISIKVISQSNSGPAAARNRGASIARGRYLAFTDDDCIPDKLWLQRLAQSFELRPDALHGGRTINLLDRNYCSSASQNLVDYVYSYYNDSAHKRTSFFASNNIAVPSILFQKIGGFDETFTTAEDRDFCRTWNSMGWKFQYVPEAIVFHAHPLTLRTLQRQHFAYGRGALPYWKKGAAAGTHRFRVEPFNFYAGMLKYPFSQRVPNPAMVASLILLSQVANAAGFAYEAVSGRKTRKFALKEMQRLSVQTDRR